MYAIEITDTSSGITTIMRHRFKTTIQAVQHLQSLGFNVVCGLTYRDSDANKDARVVKIGDPVSMVYEAVDGGRIVADTPDFFHESNFKVFKNELSGEFFASDSKIMLGPYCSADEARHQFVSFSLKALVDEYNARESR